VLHISMLKLSENTRQYQYTNLIKNFCTKPYRILSYKILPYRNVQYPVKHRLTKIKIRNRNNIYLCRTMSVPEKEQEPPGREEEEMSTGNNSGSGGGGEDGTNRQAPLNMDILDITDTSDVGTETAKKQVIPPIPSEIIAPACSSTTSTTGTNNIEAHHNLFGQAYRQCSAARAATLSCHSTDISLLSSLGTRSEITEERVGDLGMCQDDTVKDTFRGSRISAGGRVVNQTISMTFDPSTLTCTTCKVPHSIVPRNGASLAIIATDQNFVSSLSGKENCVPIIRMEDPSLAELFHICHEIFDRTPLPSGTIFLVSSLSYLVKVGATLYSTEWQRICRYFSERWGHSSIGPLPPTPRSDTAGTVGELLTQLYTWYNHCYGTSINYLKGAWSQLIDTIASNTHDYIQLHQREVLTVAMPENLTSTTLAPFKFHRSTCHAVTPGLDGGATDVLLHVLLDQLSTSYGCQAHPEDILARVPAELEDVANTHTTRAGHNSVIIMGGSHAKRLVAELRQREIEVIDLSIPGWTPTEDNIKKLVDKISKLGNLANTTAICDMLSNVTYRFEQFDGTLCLSVNLDGKWHMPGKVTTCPKEAVKHMLNQLKPIFDLLPGMKLCLPPLPRYLYTPCCTSRGHCMDLEKQHYAADLIGKSQAIRKTMRDHLHATVSRIWVPDIYGGMFPESRTAEELAESFGRYSCNDGVHLTPDGYGLLADVVKTTITEQAASFLSVAGRRGGEKPRDYYWRGFVSPIGSERPTNHGAFHHNRNAGGGKWKGQSMDRFKAPSLRGKFPRPPPGGRNWH